MHSVTAQAPAKINLWLSVGPPADDGFHPLMTIFHAIDLRDEVTATATAPGTGIVVTAEGDGAADVPLDSSNLVWLAAELLADAIGVEPDVSLHITKRIPIAGGMAGGSADAAATLVACDALWGAGISRDSMTSLAAALGSDVPFSIHGGTALGTGRGDRVTPMLARGDFHWVVAAADGGLSTPTVYGELDRMRAGDCPELDGGAAVAAALTAGDPVALGRALRNDLQPAALSLRPTLGRLLEAGQDAGALGSIVSGSGPTCVFLAHNADHALDIAVELSGSGLCRTVSRAFGPASGAQVTSRF